MIDSGVVDDDDDDDDDDGDMLDIVWVECVWRDIRCMSQAEVTSPSSSRRQQQQSMAATPQQQQPVIDVRNTQVSLPLSAYEYMLLSH